MINHLISIDQYNKNKLENFFRLTNRERYGYTQSVLTAKHQLLLYFMNLLQEQVQVFTVLLFN